MNDKPRLFRFLTPENNSEPSKTDVGIAGHEGERALTYNFQTLDGAARVIQIFESNKSIGEPEEYREAA